jgi:NAD-dependent deacetylase
VRRRDALFETLLSGYGALFFAPSARAGALFLCGEFAASPEVAVSVLLGLLGATAAARLLRRPEDETRSGLGVYHGALVAYFSYATPMDDATRPLWVLGGSALASALAAWIGDGPWRGRLNLPLVSVPALLVGYAVIAIRTRDAVSVPADWLFPSFLTSHDLFRADLYDADFGAGFDLGGGWWIRAGLFALGYGLHSPRLLALSVGGVLLGALVGFAGLGFVGALSPGFVVYCAAPTFIGLAGFFTAGGLRAVLFGALGVVASFVVWFEAGVRLGPLGVPLLTAPQAVATIGLLLCLRPFAAKSPKFLPRLVPLLRATDPTSTAAWAAEVEAGKAYWNSVADAALRPWTAFARPARMRRARERLRRARKILVVSGAGLSTESGIPDYRTGAVAWKKYDVAHFRFEKFLASEESRKKYWEMSQDFYLLLRTAEPNAAHRAIAELHRRGKLLAVVTQNVDRLHQKAGVPDDLVIELHGNEHGVTCLSCGRRTSRDVVYRRIASGAATPYCTTCRGILKPDSTAFGQPMLEEPSRRALQAAKEADLLLIVGTSLTVQPAAALPEIALSRGTPMIVVNLTPTDLDYLADTVLRGPAGVLLPTAVA